MQVMNQKEAVFQAVTNVCEANDEGKFVPTSEESKTINQILFEGFKAGRITFDGALPDDTKLKSYCSGLKSNWLRKDKRLNGNIAYVPKNPGSRVGSTDPQVKAMRTLLQLKEDPKDRQAIEKCIAERLAQIKPTKVTELTAEQIEVLEAAGLGHLVSSA